MIFIDVILLIDYFYQVVEYMESKPPADNRPVHIINIDIQDNHEEATMGAFLICDLAAMVVMPMDYFFAFIV